MNRVIKFRAWSSKGEPKMIQLVDGKIGGRLNDLQDEDDWKVMQFTGLKDKNGKECYEGDIIRDCEDDRVYKVKWHDDVDYPAFDTDPIHSNGDSNGFSYMAVGGDGFEVIGNIWENKDLLDERK